ncbi:MAG: hypothetical protein DDT42_01106 [candidate division WS2 bacterium]|uniref:AAA+ ATPase domain-containing protein n=1 Tax=Psychracetigena formicireducens TaxID=2986056 RepID=A0A9E2BIL4_PSYF1|nr:hypothetical protein [Candidatus Psychracetigena formicireducens]
MGVILLPKIGEHIIFCGTTGSGKTYLAMHMLDNYERYFIFDTHNALDLEGVIITNPFRINQKLKAYNKIIYRPELKYRTKEAYNYVIKNLVTKGGGKNRIIYIDEIFHLGFGMSFPDWLSRGISTARQRKTSFWISSQRPSNIPMAILTEARRIYIYYLSYSEDIKKLSKFSRNGEKFIREVASLGYDYSFVELDRIKGDFVKHTPLKI